MRILLLCGILFSFLSISSENTILQNRNNLSDASSSKNYIRFDFGFSRINTMFVTKSDSLYIVSFAELAYQDTIEGKSFFDMIFASSDSLLKDVRYTFSDAYNPLFYKLSLINYKNEYVLSSTYMNINNNDCLRDCADSLRTNLINIWAEYIRKTNSDVIRQ